MVLPPVDVAQRKGNPLHFDTDEFPRYRVDNGQYVLDTSMEQLARLRPVFRQGGTVTAGNSSGLNDGSAALLLMCLVPIGALALYNRRIVVALQRVSRPNRPTLTLVRRMASAELALSLVIVVVASVLVAQVPGTA